MKRAGIVGAAVLAVAVFCGCEQKAVAEAGLWQADYDAAMKQAVAENKPVLVSISGLTWCGWCIKLEKEVFSQPEFTAYAKDNLVCVLLDFDRAGKSTNVEFAKQHEALLNKFQIQGFPTVLILNPQGKLIDRTGYQPGGAAAYVKMIKGIIAANPAK